MFIDLGKFRHIPFGSISRSADKTQFNIQNSVNHWKLSPPVLNGIVFTLFLVVLLGSQALAQGGRLDLKFPLLLADDANITAIETQTDGKILIAGKFTTTGAVLRKDIVRLNTDGTIDTKFDAGTGSDNIGLILAIKLQTDGKIMVAGTFNMFNGVFRPSVIRLNTDGGVDSTFALSGLNVTFAFDVDIQLDGKILITASNLIGSSFVARFTSSGANDGGIGQPFFAISGSSGYLITYLPAESKILVSAVVFGSPNQGVLTRVPLTGGQDNTFNLPINGPPGNVLIDTRLLSNGKYLVFGKFDSINTVARKNIAIVNPDGTVDPSFIPDTAGTGTILSAAVQADGKVLIGGTDFLPNGSLHGNLGRLNAGGSVDQSFNPGRGANLSVKALQIVGNKLLVGGTFFRFGLFPRAGLVQIKL